MTRLPTHVSALALMTIDLAHLHKPTARPRGRFDHLHVVGYGLLSHRVRADGRMTFGLDTCAIGAGTSERELANSLEDDLTDVGLLTGYDLLATALPLLLSVTTPGDHLSIAALASAPPTRFCDLTQTNWAGRPTSFRQACEQVGIDTIPADAISDQMLWSFAFTEHMTAVIAERAIATWRLWLAHHADASGHSQACAAASAQFDAWLGQHPLPVFDSHGRPLPTSRPQADA